MKRNIIIAVLLLTAISIGSVLWLRKSEKPVSQVQPEPTVAQPQPQAPRPEPKKAPEAFLLRFSPKNGQTVVYKFETQSEADIDFGFLLSKIKTDNKSQNPVKQEKSHVILKASGDLCLKFYEMQTGVWNVAAFMEGLTYQLNNVTPAYAKALEFPFVFRMNAGGYLSDFQFTAGIPDEAKEFIRQLLYTLQTGFPSEAKTGWKTRETDVNGTYLAEYAIEDTSDAESVRLNKRKLEYTAVQAGKDIPGSQIRIEKSRNTVSVPRDGAWLLTLEGEESSSSSSEGFVWGKSTARYSARQISEDISGKFPDMFDKFLAALNSQKYKKSKYYATDEQFDKLGAGLDMKGALAKYSELKNSGINNARSVAEKFLVNYLRQNPQASSDLVNALDKDPKREQYDQSTQLILWRLLTQAGHTEAQQALIGAATDPEYSDLTHIRAVAYVHDFENPEPFLAQQLWDLYKRLPADSAKPEDQELRTMSLYAIGSLGYKDKLNDEIKPEIGRKLTENLKNTDNPGEQAVTLSAIGNYGGSEILNDITPYFSSSDERVRASAYDAIRRMDAPEAVGLLAKSVKTEESPKVREKAFTTLAEMPPTSAGVELAKKEVLSVENPKEQEPLVKVIGENLKTYPQNEQVLRDLLQKAPDNRVKKEIYKYIVPK
ncbi:MAG: hypothetical protein BWK80_22055 [Desulfobacteraceae bacterium IS3]|nr:MAG: hypothetical protein BWK80_22055 [Desulfobacteraceae bacterium IS3]